MKAMPLMAMIALTTIACGVLAQQSRPLCTPLSNPFRLNLPILSPKPFCGQCARPDECAQVGGRLAEVSAGCEDVQELDQNYACCTNRLKDDDSCGIGFPPIGNTRPPSRDPNFEAASFLFTKASAMDSPSRYWAVVETLIAEAIRMEFNPDVYNGNPTYRARLECPNEGYTPTGLPWREGGLSNSTTVTIMSKSMPPTGRFDPFDGLLLDVVLNVTFRCRYSISVGICPVDFLCKEVCKIRSADSLVALKLSSQSLPVQLIFSRDAAGDFQIKPNATVRVKFDNFEFGKCGADLIKLTYGPLRDYFNITGEKLLPAKLNEKFDRVLNNSIAIKGGEYRPTSDLVIGYRISNLTFDPSWVRADVSMNVSAVLNGTRVYYEFSPNHTVTGPSTEFQALSKLIQSPTGSIATLNALRVSLDIATAVMGAAAMVYTTFSNVTRISDAEIEYTVTIAGPELSVPEGTSNVVQALLPSGVIVATCNSEPNRGEPLVSINFNNVAGSMSIEYTVGNVSQGLLPGLVLQYRDVNVSGARIRLTAPPFPIDGDVLQNAVEQSLRNRQAYVNDQLRARPLQLPASVAPFFPSPRITVTPVARGSGYFELATRCKCGGQFEDFEALKRSCKVRSCTDCVTATSQCSWCGDLCFDGATCPAGTQTPLNDSTLCPPISGGFENYCRFECSKITRRRSEGDGGDDEFEPVPSARLRAHADAVEWAAIERRRVAALKRRRDAQLEAGDKLAAPAAESHALAARAAPTFLVQTYETGNCSLAVPGSWWGAQTLMETDGVCVENEGVYYLNAESRGPFYSIRRNPDGTYRLKLMCSAIDCLQCAVVQRSAALNTCYPTQVSASVSFAIQAQDGSECIGGNADDGNEFVVLYSFDDTAMCDTSVKSDDVADVVSLGTPQSITALTQCTDLDPTDEYRSSYSRVVFESTPAPRISTLEFLCLGGCVNCTIKPNMPIAVGDAGCFAGQTSVRDMEGAVTTYAWAVQAKMLGGCRFDPAVPPMPVMNVTRTEAPDLLGDSDTVLYALGIVVAIVVVGVCAVCAVRLPVVAGLIDPGQGSRIAGIRHWMSRHSWTIGLPRRGARWQFLFNLLAVVLGVVMVVVWSSAHAIRLIDANFLSENFSVDEKYDEYISSSALSERFLVWEESGAILMSIEVAIMVLLLIDTLITRHHNHDMPDKKKKHNLVGIRVRKSLWFLVLAGHVSMLLVLPLQTAFGVRDDVKFDASSLESLSAAKTTIDQMLGYAASLFMFNVVLTFFTNLLQLIPAGILLGTALYVGDVGEPSLVSRGIVVGRGVWVTAALVTIAAHIIVPVALSPAVLIYLHRRGMATSFWVGLVWLIQWVGSLLLVALVFFRRVGPAPDKRGHVLVFSHIFFCAYFAIMAVTTVVEISYTITGGNELAYHLFMLLYRLTSFLIATCFTRVWLQAYRPQYSRAALKARREKEHVDAAKAEVEAAAAAAEGQQEGESKFEKAVSPFTAALGRVGGLVAKPIMVPLASVAYAIEVGRPTTDSLPYRRTWWFFGVLFLIVVLIDNFVTLIKSTAKEEAVASFNAYSDQLYGLKWPDDDVGGAIFDPAFSLFNTLRWTKFIIVVLVGALIAGLLIDDFRTSRISQEATQRSVWRAQQAAYIVIIALFVAAVTPSVPDYPAVASLKEVLPKCGYNFNDFVQNMYGSIVGSVLTLFTVQVLLPVLTIIMPSLSRTCKMVIHGVLDAHHHDDDAHGHGHGDDDHDKSSCAARVLSFHPDDGPAPPAVIDHAHMLFQMSMIVSPLLVGLALIFFFVFFGNTFTLIMILVNFIGPIIVGQLLSPFAITTSYFAAVWFFYFPSLIAIFLEYSYRMGYLDPSKIAAYLSSWGFWITFIFVVAEVCLANVLVADIVYLLIWSLYPEYSVLGADMRAAVLSERSATMSTGTFSSGGGAGGAGGYNSATSGVNYDRGFGHGGATYNGAITVANPAFGGTMGGGVAATSADPNRASVAIRELDDEFGGQRYGNVPPPDAPFLSARGGPPDMMSARDFSLRDRGVTTFGMADLPAPSFKSRAFTDFTSMQSLQSAPSQPGFMSATPTQLNLMSTGTSSASTNNGTSGVVHSPRAYNPGGQFVCAVCGNTYPLQSDLDVHMTKRHPMVLDI